RRRSAAACRRAGVRTAPHGCHARVATRSPDDRRGALPDVPRDEGRIRITGALMPLEPGQKLASYEILSPLGAGGMGEVWRARDTRLGRDVAIKALPDAFARDPERLARFEREAKLLASLNHPNVGAIYGLEVVD